MGAGRLNLCRGPSTAFPHDPTLTTQPKAIENEESSMKKTRRMCIATATLLVGGSLLGCAATGVKQFAMNESPVAVKTGIFNY